MKLYKTELALPGKRAASLFALTGIILGFGLAATAQTVQTNLAVTVRHAPSLNGGTIQGSLQQLNGESATVNGGFAMTGDLLVPGTPTLRINGNPTLAGTVVGAGSTSPTGYQITLNGNCSLRYLRTRTTPVSLPTVSAPPSPTGTRNVTINSAGQSYGDATTLRDLTLNGNVGMTSVPPGTYGTFTVNGGSGLVLGVAGGLQAVNYNLQNLNLNGSSMLKIVGPVVLTVANGFTANGTVGASNNPAWLQLQVASGGFTLNGGCTVYGLVLAPNGTVIINGNSTLMGTSASDQFTLNGGGLVSWGGSSTQTNSPPPVATPQNVTLAENNSTNITLTGSDSQGRTLTFTLLTLPAHGTASGTPPSVTYRPATNYFGSDSFTFKVNNGITDSSPATVSLTVTQVYYLPTAFAQSLTNLENSALPVTLTGYDPQGYALTFSVLTQPAHGTLSGTAPNLTYQPATNYFGNDSFTFRVNDGVSNSLAATISITNRPVDEPPIVVAGPNQLIILPTDSVNLAGSVTYDVFPGTVDTILWSKVSGPGNVTFGNPSNTLTTATFSQSGLYRLRLFASDSFLSSSNDLFITVDAPPVVSAGLAMTNTFPGTITLLGSASDDGLPTNGTLTVVWSKITGPGTVVFGNAAATNSTATFSTNGVYVLRLTADDSVATNHSDVTVIENLPPVVNAGTSILANGLNATLSGTVTDDGLPMAFLSARWSQSTGPGTIIFGNAAATNTTVTASQSGTYVLVLTAYDGAATNSGEMVVTFNLPPVVNAGPTQTVNFGVTVTLAGTVTDDQLPYNILTNVWTKVSGPGNATFANAGLTNTTVTFDQPGIYTLRLTASDTLATTSDDVVIWVNAAPVVNVGANQLVTLGTLVALAGSYTDDGIPGSAVTTLWTQISGPAGAVFTDSTSASTTVSLSQSGVYVLQLTANDGLTNGSAQVTITVDQAPVVTAVSPILINLPANQVVLSGTVTDDGLPNGGTLTSIWSQISGPGQVNFSSPTSTSALNGTAITVQPSTTATFTAPGLYELQLAADDGLSTNHVDFAVTVNQTPTVNAGMNQTITWPARQVVLQGTAADDGLPVGSSLTTSWSEVSGPGTVTFADASATNTTATFSAGGVYVLKLTASDGVSSSSSTVTITLDQGPVVVLATPAIITWPGNQVVLNGTVTEDGLPVGGVLSAVWTTNSGPGSVSFSPPLSTNELAGTALTNELATTATFSAPGLYSVRLTADDGLVTNAADVTVIVNQAPVVNAGAGQLVTWPQFLTLQGSVTDDGLPNGTLTINWSQVSGPGSATFGNTGVTNTTVSFDQAGVYVLRLSASDSIATSTSDVTLTLRSANQPPFVNAGNSQTNLFPSPAQLSGTATDDGLPAGGTLSTAWSLVSGPGAVSFDNAQISNAIATFSQSGVYFLRLSASDTQLTNSSYVVITMNAAPTVNAGPDQIVSETNQVSLSGTVADDGLPLGTLTSSWSVASGPGTVSFEPVMQTNDLTGTAVTNEVAATATFSQPGVYVLRLTADDSLATNAAEVTITLNQAPTVDAGPNQTIQFGQNANLQGSMSDDGLPVGGGLSAVWVLVSGPGELMFDDPYNPETSVRFSMAGTYVLRLVVTDTLATNSAETVVTVVPANQAPVVQAGPKQVVILPANANLHGTVMDDGLPVGGTLTVGWSKVSGPGSVAFSAPDSTNTTASFSEAGDYVLRLTANDSALSGYAEVKVVVRTPAMNEAPVVSAGPDKVIGLTNVAALNGTVTDDGMPQGGTVTVSWSVVSGPGTVTFENSSVTNARASFSATGTYVLRLTASDSALSATSDVTVTVYPYNQPPVVDAGPDQTIIVPDPDLLISSGLMPTNPSVEMSQSLLSVPHWNNAVGQPGFDGWVGRKSLSWSGTCLFAGGDFYHSGTNVIGQIGRWDGTNWSGLYDPESTYPGGPTVGYVGGSIGSISGLNSNLFVEGWGFLYPIWPGPARVSYRWDGQHWCPWQCMGGGSYWWDGGQVLATSNMVYFTAQKNFKATYDRADGAYMNGIPTNNDTPDVASLPIYNGITVWDWTNWASLGGGIGYWPDDYPKCVAIGKHGEVYVGGSFQFSTPTGMAYNITVWDGTNWAPLGGGITEGSVNSLAVDDEGNLYAVGDFEHADGQVVNNCAKWDGSHWSAMGNGTDIGIDGQVDVVATYGRDVYVGGAFPYAGGLYVCNIARWNGQQWMVLGQGGANGLWGGVTALTTSPQGIYVGGCFTTAGGQPANYVTLWEYPDVSFRGAYLQGRVSDDGLPVGSVLTSIWTKTSGPGGVTFADPHNPVTTATFSKAGTYVLRLTANDTEFTTFDEVTITLQGNQPPVVDAGSNQVIGFDEAAIMAGTATDDGLPGGANLEQEWTVVNGPGTVTFDDPSDPETAVTFSQPGVYVLRLSANDSQFTTHSDVTIQVLSENSAPSVQAWADNSTVVQPDAAHLHGNVGDDGLPTTGTLTWCWSQVSGPGAVVFADVLSLDTSARFPLVGTYVLRLTASDSQLSSSADVTLWVVSSSPGQPPMVIAGPEQHIVLPAVATLNGAVITNYPIDNTRVLWTVMNGPGMVTFADPNSPSTTADFDTPGIYELQLELDQEAPWWQWWGGGWNPLATDHLFVTVDPPASENQAPIVHAGSTRYVPLGIPATLNGAVSDDGLPAGVAVVSTWTVLSGPGPVIFGNSNVPATTALFAIAGQYVLQLSATDSELSGADSVTLNVYDPATGIQYGNNPPVVAAGPPQTVPAFHSLTLAGSVTDDGLPCGYLNYSWSQVSGPIPASFDNADSLNSAVYFGYPGTYVLRLTADDGQYVNGADVTVTVTPYSNQPPVVDAGPWRTIYLPTNTADMAAVVSDDGLPAGGTLTYQWSLASGGPVMFSDSNSLNPTVTFVDAASAAGDWGAEYDLTLTASDGELTNSATTMIFVANPASGDLPPVVDAGPDQTITLPDAAQLAGTVSDDIQPYGWFYSSWQQISGPAPVTFDDHFNPQTMAHFVAPGVYVLRLGATDFVTSASDDVVITVNPATVNQPPTVSAGPPRVVLVGVPVVLQGWAMDDGLPNGVLTTTWEFVDGPATVQFSDAQSLNTTVVFGSAGQYNLQLRASDSELESVGGVTVTVVSPPGGNQPPVVDAGPDQTLNPGNVAQLHGTVTDDGLPNGVLNHAWTQISGPGSVTFGDLNALDTPATFSDSGDYVLGLRADDGSLVTEDYVVIHIDHPVNQPPTVDAGPPQLIRLPATGTTINGSVTDDGLPAGGTLSYHWEVADASGDVAFADANSLTTTVTFLNPPIDYYFGCAEPLSYTLRLVADDSELSASNEVTVILVDPTAAGNQLDVNAGPDQTIILPDGAFLDGWRSYADECAQSEWQKVSGPGLVTFDQDFFGVTTSPQTTAHFSKPGVYVLRLLAFDWANCGSDDVSITVLSPTNHLWVETGPALCIPIQRPTVTLNGSVTDDALPVNGTLTAVWSMVSGPGNVMFADASAPATAATFDAVGIYVLRLTANDSVVTNSSDLTVTVYDPTGTLVVNAGDDQTVILPQTATLNGVVSDYGAVGAGSFLSGALSCNWSVVSAPYQVDIADSSSLQTTAYFYVSGDYILRLTASDGVLTSSADVNIHVVSPANQPPLVLLNSPAPMDLHMDATFSGIVADDGRPAGGALTVQWSVVSGPGTATFTQPSNNFPYVSIVASFSAVGDYVLQLVASDGELSTTGQVPVTVFDLYQGNQPPVVNAGPNRTATTLYPIALQGTAGDDGQPAGGILSTMWNVNSGPGEVRFSNPAQTNSIATFYLAGTYVLQLSASDGQLSSVSPVTITVNDPTNEPPFVYAGPAQTITRPAAAVLSGEVLDDGLPLGYPLTYQWTKVSGPGNVTFFTDTTTNANTTPWLDVENSDAPASATFSADGIYVLRLSASDTQFTNTDEITITALPGVNTAPQVDAGPDQSVVLPNAAILHTGVTDDGLPDGTLEIGWTAVSGPGPVSFSTVNGGYQAAFTTSGAYTLRLTASDGEFTSTDDVNVTVYDPTQPPVVQINLPLDGDIITAPTNVIGTASSTLPLSYELQYRLKPADDSLSASGGEGQGEVAVDSGLWTILASNTVSVVSNALGVLDPTLSLNGIYELRLTATDISGRTATTDPITVIFDRNLKIGQFTISFNDLAVPVPGLPIQITRTYDTRAAAAGVQGDFGIGWTMDIRNVRLQKNRSLSRNWEEYTTGSADDLSLAYHLDSGNPRFVTITFPDGRVEKFQFNPNPLDQWLMPIDYPQWNFTPIGNTLGTLEPASIDDEDGSFLYFAGSIPGMADLYDLNYFCDWFDSTNTLADLQNYPTLFRYTSAEGYKYLIDEIQGLQSVTDPNGNTLLISTNGLTWTNIYTLSASTQDSGLGTNNPSLSIAFQRDGFGRITNIVDAAGNAMSYRYDTNNNLVTFTDRTGQTNGFAYTNLAGGASVPASRHYLISITDARGITPVQNEFDADGRLVGNIDAFGNAISYGHDIDNNREYVTNRLGQVTISEYDDHGNVTHVIAADGGETFSTYDEDGNVLTTTDPLGRTASYTYDDMDNRTSVTDPLGNTTRFAYGAMHRVLSVTDPRGNSITNTFDDQGNLLAMRDPLGRVTTFTYDQNGRPVGMQNALGQTMTFAYDGAGRLAAEQDALGHETDYQRDANGNLLVQTTTRTIPGSAGVPPAVQTLAVQFQYDEQSRLTNSIFPDSSSAQTIYNAIGKPAMTIDQLGRQTIMEYDPLGRVTRTVHPDGSSESSGYDIEGRRVSSTNRLGQVTRFEYDNVGRLIHTLNFDGTATTNWFDVAGQLIVSTDANGNNTFYGYDAAGRSIAVTNALGQVSRSFYDASGNLTNSVDALGHSTTFVYDELNRRVQTIFADGTTQRTWYDELGRRTYEQDQAGKTTAFGYDTLGRLTAVTNAMGYVTSYAYDELGQQISQTDANLHTTTFEYDSLGRRVKRTLPGNQVETYAYNIGGLLTSKTDFNGYTTTYQYDQMNRLVAKLPSSILNPPSSPVYYAYNILGLRTNMTDASGSTAYVYDDRNRLAQKTKSWGVALSVSLNYAYDANGNLTGIQSSDPNGANVGYEYDELNRLSAVNDATTGRTVYNYDEVGNLANYTYPNLVRSEYQYDTLNRLTNMASGQLLTPIASYAYTVGAAGNRLTATEQLFASTLNTQPKTINRAYTYDNLYRLTGETINGAPSTGSASYNYDPVGNRLARNSTLPELLSQSFSFDANDRLTTDQYDANGNTVVGRVTPCAPPVNDSYDFENRLIHRTNPGGSTVDIRYDGDGNRVSKTVTTATNSTTTYYVVDDLNPSGYAQVLEELSILDPPSSNIAVTKVYTYGHTLISQTIIDPRTQTPSAISYYGFDGHNNVRYLTDVNGTVTDTYDYDAFGNLISQSAISDLPTPNSYLFTGEQFDLDLGLYYLRARYHNPDTGRFWTEDSYEGNGSDPASLHKYTYCKNNPVNAHDPSGHETLCEISVATGIAAGVGFTLGGWEAYRRGGSFGDIVEGAVAGGILGAALGPIMGELPILMAGPAGQMTLFMFGATAGGSAALDLAQYPDKPDLAALDIICAFAPFLLTSRGALAVDDWELGVYQTRIVSSQETGGAQIFAAGAEPDSITIDVGASLASDGYKVEYVNLASPARTSHILDGEIRLDGRGIRYSGGHRSGTGFPGKSEFPADWTDPQIMHNVSDVATDPSSISRPGDRPGDIFMQGTRDGVDLEVLIRKGQIWSAYPTSVPKNP